jgi:hypothetical protein
MYVVLWQFRPLRGREREFERAYGRSGEWIRLFQRGEGYLVHDQATFSAMDRCS